MGRAKRVGDEELLAVAREAFTEKGTAVSTREIARRAGVSEAVIFQRHATKEDLFFAAMVPPPIDLEALLQHDSKESDPKARLNSVAMSMVEYLRQVVPILLPLMSHPSFDFEEFAKSHPDSSLARLRTVLIEYLIAESQKGNISPDNPLGAGLTLFSSLFGIAVLESLGVHGGKFDQSLIQNLVNSIWAGLAPAE